MSTTRGQDGRWVKPFIDGKDSDEKRSLSGPKRRGVASKERSAHLQESPLKAIFFPWSSQINDSRGIEATASRVYSHAVVFSWIVVALRIITRIIFWIIAFFFLKNIIQSDAILLAINTAGNCLTDSTDSCISKLGKQFFPENETTKQRTISFKLAASGLAEAQTIYQIEFPLFINHPLVLLIAAIATEMVYWILGYIHSLLMDVTDAAYAAAPSAARSRKL